MSEAPHWVITSKLCFRESTLDYSVSLTAAEHTSAGNTPLQLPSGVQIKVCATDRAPSEASSAAHALLHKKLVSQALGRLIKELTKLQTVPPNEYDAVLINALMAHRREGSIPYNCAALLRELHPERPDLHLLLRDPYDA